MAAGLGAHTYDLVCPRRTPPEFPVVVEHWNSLIGFSVCEPAGFVEASCISVLAVHVDLNEQAAHPHTQVWAALTTPELLARWWAPGDIAPTAGHRFAMDMGAWGQLAFQGMGSGWPGLLARIEGFLPACPESTAPFEAGRPRRYRTLRSFLTPSGRRLDFPTSSACG